ncbi:MAG: hypothetical protein KGH75_12160 [Rhodospirillales bacterium]|nr:hypothetical protein [Rhodospirillales bacterium]
MATSDSPIPISLVNTIAQNLEKLASSNQSVAIATLTAAIVNARGKPTSIKEVLEIAHDINFTMHPAPNFGSYKEWLKTKDQRLAKIYE